MAVELTVVFQYPEIPTINSNRSQAIASTKSENKKTYKTN